MIKMQISGGEVVSVRLRNIAERVGANARKSMHRSADRVVKKAKANAPVDTHDLENDIVKTVGYEGAHGRLKVDVRAGEGESEQYAAIMHESDYKLGPKSREKQANAAPGVIVGRKYLERALEDEEGRLISEINAVVDVETRE